MKSSAPPSATTRRQWLYGGAAALALAAGAGSAWWRRSRDASGEEAALMQLWGQRFAQPQGGELSMGALRGRPLLINFWATWCPPCIAEMPLLDGFYHENSSNGWQLIGLAIDHPDSVRRYLQRAPVSYPIGLVAGQGTQLLHQLGNTNGGLPFTLLFNGQGRMLARKMGKLASSDLDAWRQALLRG